ncbi:MAG: TatD family hydrolase [Hahellaceae bacterium]|nr:TatD family hydrolase [Hahellaceae bacterium]
MFIDSHCHLDRLKLDAYEGDLNAAINAARACGVSKMLCVGIDLDNVHQVISIAQQHEYVYASVGVHPSTADGVEPSVDLLVNLANHPKVVAIGETGLDYYYGQDSAEAQKERFRVHLRAAKEVQMPVIVHTRDAKADTLSIIREEADFESAGVLHCFTEDLAMAKSAMDMNFYISFSGIVTFRNADALREVAKAIPLDRMLIETDSPYLAPVPYRGKSNEPKYVVDVARFVAELRGISIDALAQSTTNNFHKLFSRVPR